MEDICEIPPEAVSKIQLSQGLKTILSNLVHKKRQCLVQLSHTYKMVLIYQLEDYIWMKSKRQLHTDTCLLTDMAYINILKTDWWIFHNLTGHCHCLTLSDSRQQHLCYLVDNLLG